MVIKSKNETTNRALEDIAESTTELNFSDDEPTRSFKDLVPESAADLTGAPTNVDDVEIEPSRTTPKKGLPGSDPSEDDLAPEILIKEDGALSPREKGDDRPADRKLTVVDIDKIGAGSGLDEAEWAELDPLNKTQHAKNQHEKNSDNKN